MFFLWTAGEVSRRQPVPSPHRPTLMPGIVYLHPERSEKRIPSLPQERLRIVSNTVEGGSIRLDGVALLSILLACNSAHFLSVFNPTCFPIQERMPLFELCRKVLKEISGFRIVQTSNPVCLFKIACRGTTIAAD